VVAYVVDGRKWRSVGARSRFVDFGFDLVAKRCGLFEGEDAGRGKVLFE
jgi:hypothetical protein